MEFKKVVVNSVDMRKFAEALVYLGSIGAEVTKNCVAVKGLMLRAEVELPWDVPVNETENVRVSMKDKIVRDVPQEQEVKKPATKKTTNKKSVVETKEETKTEESSKEDSPATSE